jgi:hypothetical protein
MVRPVSLNDIHSGLIYEVEDAGEVGVRVRRTEA